MISEIALFLQRLVDANKGQFVWLVMSGIVIYLGALAAFTLGALFMLPSVVIASANSATLIHIAGQMTLIATLALVSYRIAHLLAVGCGYYLVFLLCKYRFGHRRTGGVSNPTIERLQRRLNYSISEGRRLRKTQLVLRLVLVVLTVYLFFFRFENRDIIVAPTIGIAVLLVPLMGAIAVSGTLTAYRVGIRVTYGDFLSLEAGRQLLITSTLFLLMLTGALRSLSLVHGPTFTLISEAGMCQLAPIFPIQGGDLYFDQASLNFVVMAGETPSFIVPGVGSKGHPACVNN